MRKLRCLLCCFVLTGCVVSVEAVVRESDAMFDARLLGRWAEAGGSDRAVVSRGDTNGYAIEYTDGEGNVGRYEARLGRLGRKLVLDVWPAARASALALPEAAALIRGHVLFTVDIAADSVRVAMFKPDSLRAALANRTLRLSHLDDRDQLILTGTTDDLRRGLAGYIDRPGALDEPGTWRRVLSNAPMGSGPAPPATSPATSARPVTPPTPLRAACFEPNSWREADLLFHRDPHWVGSDGASSVDLGGGRTLWLFGDTWIDPSGAGTRRGARMVSNTLAIQRGTDPSSASIAFYWGRSSDGQPAAFFPDRGGERLWLGNGVRVDDRLVLFLNRIRSVNTGLGFQSVGWTAFSVANPDAERSAWRVTELETPPNPLGVIVGYAAVLRLGEYVYAFGSEDPVKSHPLYAVRWPAGVVRQGNLMRPEWWAGVTFGWVPDSSPVSRFPLFENGSSDLTVHFDVTTNQFIAVQSVGFGPADVMMRTAPALTGPWTAPRMLYRPPEFYRPNVMIYSAKAHPELTGADVVLTYANNSFQFADHLADNTIYYPRFLRLARC